MKRDDNYYNKNKVLDIIKNYANYKAAINEHRKQYRSIGVTIYNEEAALPRANTLSDPTATEGIKHAHNITALSNIATDMKYVQDRLDRVPKHLRHILDLRLSGISVKDIYLITNKSQSAIYNDLNKIAKYICGEI